MKKLFLLFFAIASSLQISAQQVTTFAGDGVLGNLDGQGVFARLRYPYGICVDTSTGDFYFTNSFTIRKMTASGYVTTLAGSGTVGSIDGTGTSASFNACQGICFTGGNLYVVDRSNHKIRKITLAGVVTTFAGSGSQGWVDGQGTAAKFKYPSGICADAVGNLYVSDFSNYVIRKITPQGEVSTLAGSGIQGYTDGPGDVASFSTPSGICVDKAGNVFVADWNGIKIRKIAPDGTVSSFAGSNVSDGHDGTGTGASFTDPRGICMAPSGDFFVSEGNGRIRKISAAGVVTTVAGSGVLGAADGVGTAASFNNPFGLCSDLAGDIFIADTYNHLIRKMTVSPCGDTTLAASIPDLCTGSGTFDLNLYNGTSAAGNWTIASGPVGYTATVSNGSTFNINSTIGGVYTVRHTLTNTGFTCATYAERSFTISSSSTGGSVTGSSAICTGTNSGLLTLSGHNGNIVRWESSTNNFVTKTDIVNTSTTLNYSNLTTNTKFRAVVASGKCTAVNSASATLTVDPLSIGGVVGTDATVCTGANSGILSLTGNVGTVVGWKSSTDDFSTETSIANVTSSQNYTNLTQTTKYLAVTQSGSCPAVNSTFATITVSTAPIVTPSQATVIIGASASFSLTSNFLNSTYQWQSNVANLGWMNISDNSTYSGATTNKLDVKNISLFNLGQQFKLIVKSVNCTAESNVAAIDVNATCNTLVITSNPLGISDITKVSVVSIYPNPTNDQVIIDCGNLSYSIGWNIKIFNALSQEVFSGALNKPQYVVSLNTFGASGVYLVKIFDNSGTLLNTNKIVLQ
jgi:hypothetical protein